MNDNVNHPSHYTSGKVECIDALESATENLQGIEAVCTANAIKYLWRWKQKNGAEDLKKAKWYIDRLIEQLNSNSQLPKNNSDVLNQCYKGKIIKQGDTVKITLLSGELIRGYVRFIDATAIRLKEYIYLWVIPPSIIKEIEVIK